MAEHIKKFLGHTKEIMSFLTIGRKILPKLEMADDRGNGPRVYHLTVFIDKKALSCTIYYVCVYVCF